MPAVCARSQELGSKRNACVLPQVWVPSHWMLECRGHKTQPQPTNSGHSQNDDQEPMPTEWFASFLSSDLTSLVFSRSFSPRGFTLKPTPTVKTPKCSLKCFHADIFLSAAWDQAICCVSPENSWHWIAPQACDHILSRIRLSIQTHLLDSVIVSIAKMEF